MKKIKTILTKDNLFNYTTKESAPEGDTLRVWELEKLGTWLEIQSLPANYALFFDLPSIEAPKFDSGYDIDILDYARSLVGNTLVIINKTSRPLYVRGYISEGGREPMGGLHINFPSGYTMSCTCKMRKFPNSDGTSYYEHLVGVEEIYWEVTLMKTMKTTSTT